MALFTKNNDICLWEDNELSGVHKVSLEKIKKMFEYFTTRSFLSEKKVNTYCQICPSLFENSCYYSDILEKNIPNLLTYYIFSCKQLHSPKLSSFLKKISLKDHSCIVLYLIGPESTTMAEVDTIAHFINSFFPEKAFIFNVDIAKGTSEIRGFITFWQNIYY